MGKRQRENIAKYLYDLSKGVALIAVVGALAGGQASVVNVTLSVVTAGVLLLAGYWVDGDYNDPV